MNKRFLNGSNSPTNNRAHVVNQKNECWAELAQFQSEQQQQEYNHSYHNSNHQSRRQQNKFQSIKNHSKPYNKTSSYSNNFKINDEKQQRVLTEDFNYQNNKIFTSTVYEQHIDSSDSGNGVVPCMPLDQSPSDDSNFCPDSPEASVSSSQSSLENKENEDYSKNESNRDENNMLNQSECNQNNYSACNSRCNHQQQTQMIEIPQLCEINCNTSGIYNNGLYDYEYQAMNAHHLMQQQTPPQYYVYHPYSEYGAIPNVTGSPLLNTPITPQQHQQTPQYYTTYQTIAPSYYYDPSGTYTPSNMASPFSTPQTQPPQQQQQIISSPQQTTILASYQTPPPPQHQLYMTPASMSPPTSISPNQMLSNNSSATISNERLSNCNSPLQQHQLSNVLQNNSQQVNQTPTNQNSFVMYTPGANPYLTQQFQCQSPSQSYLMYHAPPQVNTIQSQGPMQPAQMQSPPVVYSSYQNSPMMSPQINNNVQSSSNNNNNRFNKSKARYSNNQFNNFHKRNFSQKFNNSNQFANMQQSNMIFSPLESIYLNNPILNTQPPGTYDDYLNDELTQKLVDPNVTVYSPPPPQIYCDINGNLIGMPNPDSGDYDSNGISSYGDEYDSYDENSNSDDNDENLACTVCRGRRMCFCYFLKVRYYKFPSFFDLVDHQYKKWRSTMAKAKKV